MTFKMVYDYNSRFLVDYIVDNYDIDIECWDIEHHKEKKTAITIKVAAGTRLDPFIGAYNEDDEIVDALWGENTKITEQTIDTFLNKYVRRKSNL